MPHLCELQHSPISKATLAVPASPLESELSPLPVPRKGDAEGLSITFQRLQ